MKGKKATKRALLSSALSLVLCFSMLLGTTFAWFTDEASTAVNTIVSGTLDVDLIDNETNASLDGESLSFKNFEGNDDNGDNEGYWEPNCTYHTQGFKVANLGNLWLKYQLAIGGITGDLMLLDVVDFYLTTDVSSVEAAEANRVDIDTFVEKLAPNGQDKSSSTTYYLVGHMDENAGNEYQNKTLNNIAVTVYATQVEAEFDSFGNNYDKDAPFNDFTYDVLATPETIERVLAEAKEGDVIGLDAGEYGSLKIPQDNLTLISNGSAVVGYIDLNAKDNTVIDGLTFDAAKAQAAWSAKSGATTYVTNITGTGTDEAKAKAADGTIIRDCTFTGTPANVDTYAPIFFEEQGRATERTDSITVTNCSFECNAINYVRLNYLAVGSANITNNTFGGVNYGTTHNTINATGNAADWTITGNTFWNWNAEKAAFGSGKQNTNTNTITVKNNEFYNTSADQIPVLNLKNSYTTENLVLNYSGNTANYGTYTLAAVGTPVAGENDVYYYMTKDATSSVEIVAPGVVKTGTKAYDVYGAEGLMNMESIMWNHGSESFPTFTLMGDIDMSGYDWTPVSYRHVIFDGNNHTISNLNCVQGVSGKSGFFAYLGGATIKNLTLENVTAAGCQAGAFAGQTEYGTITNCVLKGDNTITWEQNTTSSHVEDHNAIGAIVGHSNATTVSGVEIAEGATVTLNKGTMTTVCSRSDKLVSGCGTPTGTVTNNGKIYMNVTVDSEDALLAAVKQGATTVTLTAGEYDMPDFGQGAVNGVTFKGVNSNDVVIKLYNTPSGGDFCLDGSTATLENMKIVTEIKDNAGFQNAKSLTFNKCEFKNNLFLTGNATFNDCHFEVTTNHYNVWANSANSRTYTAEFNRCVFDCAGKSIYIDGNPGGTTTMKFTGCTFNDNDGGATDKAAIETGTTYGVGATYNVVIKDCEFDGFAAGKNTDSIIWANKNSMTSDKLNITIDDVDVF